MQSQEIKQLQTNEKEKIQDNYQSGDNHLDHHKPDHHQSNRPQLHLVTEADLEAVPVPGETVEPVRKRSKSGQGPVTSYYWCRTCRKKTPINMAKSCDCGITMCNSCWEEWDVTCPICDTSML